MTRNLYKVKRPDGMTMFVVANDQTSAAISIREDVCDDPTTYSVSYIGEVVIAEEKEVRP